MGSQQRAEAGGLLCALIAAGASWGGMRLYLDYAPSQWLVATRIFIWCALIITVCAVVAFVVGYTRLSGSWSLSQGWLVPLRKLFEVLSLSAVYGSTVFLAGFVILNVVNAMIGIQLGGIYLISLIIGSSAVMGYFGYVQGELLTAKTVASLLPLFVLSGVGAAGMTTDDPNWWRNNFSQLGDNLTPAGTMFNITLIMAGVCVVIISYFSVYELIASHQQFMEWQSRAHAGDPNAPASQGSDAVYGEGKPDEHHGVGRENLEKVGKAAEKTSSSGVPQNMNQSKTSSITHFRTRVSILMILLVLAGVCLAGVGIFRYTPHPGLHNLFARGMMVPMYTLLLALPWLAPQLSKMVFIVSDIFVVVIGVSGIMWTMGMTSLTNVEGLTWMLFMAWFIIFARQVAALEADRVYAQLKYDTPGQPVQSRLSPKQ